QSSDWGLETLSEDQLTYAATDVLYLHTVRERLIEMLAREGRTDLAQKCFDFLHTRTDLDLAGWAENDIFAHK
ncbi:MAG: ribonuclease D, partial [Magnetovibrio sp.]|nr:ribonuclease D [Magnetovibrio sp.]